MKKINVILLIFSFVLSGIGGIFLFGANATQQSTMLGNAPVEEIMEYTYKTYDELLTDLDITSEKMTEKDYTGAGKKDNPYIINSTRGFLYFASYTKNKVSMNYKYFELNCDIILNDETFDEDGNPSGGDGVVYTIDADFTGALPSINGNGHKISGWYFNDETKYYVTIFKRNTHVKKAENLIFENIYVAGDVYVSIFHYADEIENCVIRNGNFNGNQNITTFSQESKHIRNCKNFANVHYLGSETNKTHFSGINITIKENGIIENTYNYGNIFGCDYNCGITSNNHPKNMTLRNCINYGEIHGRAYTGGIMAAIYKGSAKILNCKNYGDIYNDAYSAGGAIGYCYGGANIDNFVHDANIIAGSNAASFIGFAQGIDGVESNITITNSVAYMNVDDCANAQPFLGRIYPNTNVYADNNKININNKTKTQTLAIILSLGEDVKFVFKNAEININSDVRFNFYYINDMAAQAGDVDLENVYLKTTMIVSSINFISWNPGKIKIGNKLIHESSKGDSVFYGSDFSGFYFSWRDGKLGLVALDGRGSFQGQIDEEWLKSKGFTKKEV